MESIGLPYYAITYENLKNIGVNRIMETILDCSISILNFYVTVLLVFSFKETKSILKYAISYMLISWLIYATIGYLASQVFIISYIVLFCYYYSNKNKKYILYGMLAMFINLIIQGIAYQYKIKLIDYESLNRIAQVLLSTDYFIIMIIIILVKEIYLRKRGDKKCQQEHQVFYGGVNSKKKETLQRN